MPAVIRSVARISVAVAFLLIATAAPARSGPVVQPSPHIASMFYPEVRLRKLHLVRPDLIPYPIYFDVYC